MSNKRQPSRPSSEQQTQPEQQNLELLVYQVLLALSRYQHQMESEPPALVVVPRGQREPLLQLDIVDVAHRASLPMLQGLPLQEIERLSELWRAIVTAVPVVESDDVQQVVIVTLSMNIISTLHNIYKELGLPELVQKRGVPFDQLAESSLYTDFLLHLFALDIYTELVARAPKLVIPKPNIAIPTGNA